MDPDSVGRIAGEILSELKADGIGGAEQVTAESLAGSSDAALLLIDHAFPGWSISIDGTASVEHGHWSCTLRPSETSDDAAFLGVGKSDRLPAALLAALLNAMAMRPG